MLINTRRPNATANTNRDTRTERFRVRKLRQTRKHTNASPIEEEKTTSEAEAEQVQGLAFSLSAPLAFRSPPLLFLAGELVPRKATASNTGTDVREAFSVRQLSTVVPERLLVQIPEQVERLHGNVRAVNRPLEAGPEVLHAIRVDVAIDVFERMVNDLVFVVVKAAV